MNRFAPDRLAAIMKSILLERGCSEAQSEDLVHCVIETSLRGVDSHGINLFPHYVSVLDGGRVNGNPILKVEKSKGSFSLLNADNAFGHHAGMFAMKKCIADAALNGIAAVTVTDSSHFGAAASYSLLAARQGLVGLSFCNADSLVRQPASNQRFLGTNPICIASPMSGEDPLCLDMATSLGNWNRVKNYIREGKSLELGIASDAAGEQTLDPALAYSLEPVGGYKGFGLGVLVDILCAAFSGAPFSHEIRPMYDGNNSDPRRMGQFFIALDPGSFLNSDAFEERISAYVKTIRALPSRNDEVPMAPGDPEKEAMLKRCRAGIPVDDAKLKEFFSLDFRFKECIH